MQKKSVYSFQSLLNQLYAIKWVAYCKHPFGGQRKVLEYLGCYVHRVAISNYRIQSKELLCTCQHEEPVYFECESWQDLFLALTGIDLRTCPSCGQGRMVFLETIYPEIKPPP